VIEIRHAKNNTMHSRKQAQTTQHRQQQHTIVPPTHHTEHIREYLKFGKIDHSWENSTLHTAIDAVASAWSFIYQLAVDACHWIWAMIKWLLYAGVIWLLATIWMLAVIYMIYPSMEILHALLADLINGIRAAVGAVTDVGGDISGFFGGSSHVSNPMPSASELLGTQSWYTTMAVAPVVCGRLNTWQRVIDAIISTILSKYTCPVGRYLYPTRIAYPIYVGVMAWSMNPCEPYPWANCQGLPDENLCIGFQFYKVLFYLPTILFVIATLEAFRKTIMKILRAFYKVVHKLGKELLFLASKEMATRPHSYDIYGF